MRSLVVEHGPRQSRLAGGTPPAQRRQAMQTGVANKLLGFPKYFFFYPEVSRVNVAFFRGKLVANNVANAGVR